MRAPCAIAKVGRTTQGTTTAMPAPEPSLFESRRHQMFPKLEPGEIERVRRFGEARSYAPGEALASTGKVTPGLMLILSGSVDTTQHSEHGASQLIVTHTQGSFMGELAQLSGRPALIDAH